MSEAEVLTGLATIVVLGVGSQVIANLVKLPSVLLLLAAGFVAGPATGLVDAEKLFGSLLFPGVSLAVGLLLFDGGMQLRFREIRAWQGVVVRLITVAVVVTWVVASLTLTVVTDLDPAVAWLGGAILVVSGPTVVLPILQRIQPSAPSKQILEWEGILIDPIGAMLGVVMLGFVVHGGGAAGLVAALVTGAGAGIVAGLVGAVLLLLLMRMQIIPSQLHAVTALAAATGVYTVANLAAPEAGLFATTVMGMALANQHVTPVADIAAFEESVGAMILGALFIVLGSRITPSELSEALVPGLILLAVLVIVARPLGVLASTAGTGLDRPSALFLTALAPRGIVAAATSSVFALELEENGIAGGEQLVSLTFVVIIGAGLLYGLGAGPVGRRLGVVRA